MSCNNHKKSFDPIYILSKLEKTMTSEATAATTVELVETHFRPREEGEVVATKLSKEEEIEMESLIKSYIAEEAMTPPEIDFQYTVRFQLRGSSNGEDKSLREYPRYWRELGRFAYLLDDMRTATICNDKLRPKNPLPANPVTLALFYQYKSFDRLTNVVDFNNNCVVYVHGTRAGKIVTGSCDSVERNGRIVKKNGWSDPTNVRKCRVAIRTLHNSFCLEDMSLAYIGTCEKCIKKNEAKGKINWACSEDREFLNCGGCMYPRLRPRGCPTYHKLCISMFNRVQNHLRANHYIRGALHITTKQLRQVRAHLLSRSNDIMNMQLWCMMLVGIHLFLRAQEVCSLRLSQFRKECFVVLRKEKRVDQIVLWVLGKADKVEQCLSLYRDDENPEFCPVRALLVYLAAAKLPGPYLFPRPELLQAHVDGKSLPDNWSTKEYPYRRLLKEIKVSLFTCE